MMTPAQRSLRARIAAATSWSNTTDRRARTAKATKSSRWIRHENAVLAEAAERGEELTDEQLQQRVLARQRAADLQLAAAGVAARARRRKAEQAADAAKAEAKLRPPNRHA